VKLSEDAIDSIVAWVCLVIAFVAGGLVVWLSNVGWLLFVAGLLTVVWFTKVVVDNRAEQQ
jgi:hypothetical protein